MEFITELDRSSKIFFAIFIYFDNLREICSFKDVYSDIGEVSERLKKEGIVDKIFTVDEMRPELLRLQ